MSAMIPRPHALTAFVVVDFAKWVRAEPEEHHADLKRWFAAAAARPSTSA